MFTFAVPISPPGKVSVILVNPKNLNVSFKPPPLIDHNGQLTGYMIQYNGIGSGDNKRVITKYTTMSISLSRLANYSVTVAAMNVNGTGPFSDPVVVQPPGNM